MSRFTLAFSSFFRLLFGANLPPGAAEYLPKEAAAPVLPEPSPEPEKKQVVKKAPAAQPKISVAAEQRNGALTLLSLLHREGRLVDFLRESIEDYSDADIGAAVRDIHRGCRKVLDEHVDLEAVMPGQENESVTVPQGFDPGEIRLIGEIQGDPPFCGTLRHHGWRATKIKLPTLAKGIDRYIVAPAEVEVRSS